MHILGIWWGYNEVYTANYATGCWPTKMWDESVSNLWQFSWGRWLTSEFLGQPFFRQAQVMSGATDFGLQWVWIEVFRFLEWSPSIPFWGPIRTGSSDGAKGSIFCILGWLKEDQNAQPLMGPSNEEPSNDSVSGECHSGATVGLLCEAGQLRLQDPKMGDMIVSIKRWNGEPMKSIE